MSLIGQDLTFHSSPINLAFSNSDARLQNAEAQNAHLHGLVIGIAWMHVPEGGVNIAS